MPRFGFSFGRKSHSLKVNDKSKKRNAVSLPTMPEDIHAENKENTKPHKTHSRLSLRRLSLKKLKRSRSAYKSKKEKTIDKLEISLPQHVDTLHSSSKESGYGSLSKSPLLHPNEKDLEDVFAKDNSSRLSNGDIPDDDGLFAEALWDHVTMVYDELGFKVGDVIRVVDMKSADWWWGELESDKGWFPATFVRILVNQHRHDPGSDDASSSHSEDESHELSRVTIFDDDATDAVSRTPNNLKQDQENLKTPTVSNDVDSSLKHPKIVVSEAAPTVRRRPSKVRDQMRKNVINEIVNSEKVFMGHLKDVKEGYLARCRSRKDMFSDEQLSTIFGNISEIYDFQLRLFTDLQHAVNRSAVHTSQIGKVFLNHKNEFATYSAYCNNHPQALALLSELLLDKKYLHFFEACRLLQNMIDISLDGFLLTPVQKICKYPLQLAELLKYTPPDHPDYEDVRSAHLAMKNVAHMINERKRKMENIKKITQWQTAVLNWQGEDVLTQSRELVHSGEVYMVSNTHHKMKSRIAFLFDHQMIICKKDLLRKDLLYYKKRYQLDSHVITPIEGYSPRHSPRHASSHSTPEHQLNPGNLKSGWRISSKTSEHSCVMLCKTDENFHNWMKAFPLERELALSSSGDDAISREEILKNSFQTTLAIPGKPKETALVRSSSYRARVKQSSSNQPPKIKTPGSPLLSAGAGFLRTSSIKRSPVRRAQLREHSFVF